MFSEYNVPHNADELQYLVTFLEYSQDHALFNITQYLNFRLYFDLKVLPLKSLWCLISLHSVLVMSIRGSFPL